ncbi:MAG: ferrous iron transport protein A [Bacteroidia bacterium]
MTLDKLEPGKPAQIKHVNGYELALKLFEMGVLPGERVEIENIAPFGDPIAILVGEYKLCLRLSDASKIEVTEQ